VALKAVCACEGRSIRIARAISEALAVGVDAWSSTHSILSMSWSAGSSIRGWVLRPY